MVLSSRLKLALGIAGACAVMVACSAIVGVEDVTLARAHDAAQEDEVDINTGDEGTAFDAMVGPPEASVELAAGFIHTCARKTDGKVQCWGDNGAGQVGDGISFDAGNRPSVLKPQDVVGVTNAVALASGGSHSCAIIKGGSVKCWGINSFGQLGDGTTTRSSSPVDVAGVTNAVAISGGTSFTCAVISGGAVQCWGANYAGQLGDGSKIDRGAAAPVQQLTGAIAVTNAETHACALVTGGTVKCWGANDSGQLGIGSLTESLVPTALSSLSDVVQIAAASKFTCALQRSGQVSCWGENVLGELGTGSANSAPNPSPAANAVSDAIQIWVGYQHACAVRRSGKVVCWGEAGDGQVGSGVQAPDASIPAPTEVVGISSAVAVSTSGSHSCGSTSTGAVFCWGENVLGELGNGSTTAAFNAVPVTGYP